jgi:hypothetical protein
VNMTKLSVAIALALGVCTGIAQAQNVNPGEIQSSNPSARQPQGDAMNKDEMHDQSGAQGSSAAADSKSTQSNSNQRQSDGHGRSAGAGQGGQDAGSAATDPQSTQSNSNQRQSDGHGRSAAAGQGGQDAGSAAADTQSTQSNSNQQQSNGQGRSAGAGQGGQGAGGAGGVPGKATTGQGEGVRESGGTAEAVTPSQSGNPPTSQHGTSTPGSSNKPGDSSSNR